RRPGARRPGAFRRLRVLAPDDALRGRLRDDRGAVRDRRAVRSGGDGGGDRARGGAAAVKPARFDYVAAASTDEALEAIADDEAKVLAGGQSLVRLLNRRLARPSLLVDVNRVPDLDRVELDGNVRIGALARQADVLA